MIKGTTRDPHALARAIERREDFTSSGALRGEYRDGDAPRYVIYSYAEPIAVVLYDDGRAVHTGVKFSRTTSKHQTTARQATRTFPGVTVETRIDTKGTGR